MPFLSPFSSSGRYLLFKGKKRERDAPTRRAEIAARMASMAKRVDTWKRVRSSGRSFLLPGRELAD